jgi:hypothetical protein
MVKTLMHYWPAGIQFTLYAEGFTPDIALKDVRTLPAWQYQFKQRHLGVPLRNGVLPDRPYQLLFDAVRFSHKVGAVCDAALDTTADVLIWIDADVVTHTSVPREFLDELLPKHKAMAWLDRPHKYPECGFVMFNMQHPAIRGLFSDWRDLYTQDTVFNLQHWTDCHTLQHVVTEREITWASLSGRFSNTGHPFINGPLGAVMDHLKGNRKQEGRSRRIDLRVRRGEQYWRNAR